MELLQTASLSLRTALVCACIPFGYFFYHKRYWYRPDLVRMWDFILSVTAIGILCVVGFKMATVGRGGTSADQLMVNLLHLPPPFLIFMLLANNRPIGQVAQTTGGASPKKESLPTPSNRGVERVGWDDLIIDNGLKDELISVVELLKDPKTAKRYGIEVPKGILFSGPPGTGKTTIARVLANTANLSFFVLRAEEIVSKWVGDSEKNLSRLFDAASRHAPSLIFIDEIDSIGKSRSGEQAHSDNLLNHLLQLIDGVIKREGLYIVGATNRPDLVDEALKRAGRLNRVITIGLPNFEARQQLFQLYLAKLNLKEEFDLAVLSEITEGKSGADIKEICNQAGLNAFRRESGQKKRDFQVNQDDMRAALGAFL